jgi:D-arabinose 1-dehydrogenase-like Zn-dependent alcohol dehydrogenase
MKGIRFLGQDRVEVGQFSDPEPGDSEVIVRMKASALCRSDLHLFHGSSVLDRASSATAIPGHEVCGVVERAGTAAANVGIRAGDRVAIYLGIGCGNCTYCRQGWPILCKTWKCLGFDVDGGHAELIKVPAENCLRIPDQMSFIEGALSTDKFGGLYHCQKQLGVSARNSLAIFGIGPMGQMGILCAKALGAKVIAIDARESRLELAKQIGADYLVHSGHGDVAKEITKMTNSRGADIAIDCSGNPAAQNDALSCVCRQGKVAFIGESKNTPINPSDQIIRKMLTVIGSWYFPIWEYEEISQFIVNNTLHLDKYVTDIYTLDQALVAYERFDRYETGMVVFQS